ncbi:hypothetical protein [Micromonospora sp. NPDC048063]|uniref:hypothetical protein n=1 Tax=Micromonospora sp. NPDC048063 TaxID=3364256 RepID=UPI00371EF193
MNDLIDSAVTVIAALTVGLIVGAIVMAFAARARQLDDEQRTETAWRDIRGAVEQLGDPEIRARLLRQLAQIRDRWLPGGPMHLDAYRQPAAAELTPAYVHRLLDAYATGDPVNLAGCAVPPDVRGRLRAILIGAAERTAPLPSHPGLATTARPADVPGSIPLSRRPTDG